MPQALQHQYPLQSPQKLSTQVGEQVSKMHSPLSFSGNVPPLQFCESAEGSQRSKAKPPRTCLAINLETGQRARFFG